MDKENDKTLSEEEIKAKDERRKRARRLTRCSRYWRKYPEKAPKDMICFVVTIKPKDK